MVNPFAGEVTLNIDGEARLLKLTLGALAELEANLVGDSLMDLVSRFENGKFTNQDLLMLIVAGLRGGGWRGEAKDLLSADIAGGPFFAAKAAGLALARAFSLPDSEV